MITEITNTKYLLLLFLRISVSNQRSVLNVIYSPAITELGKNRKPNIEVDSTTVFPCGAK